jgi:hypothetical protein
MTLREEIMNGLADLNPKRIEIDKGAEVKGRPVTEYKVFFDTPKGEVYAQIEFANDLKVGGEQIVRVLRSYVIKDLEAFQ